MKLKAIIFLIMAAVASYLFFFSEGPGSIKEGDRAPNFNLSSRQGAVSLEQYRGKVVLVNFWATWCPACQSEMSSLEALNRRMEGKPFQLLAVSEDEEGWGAIDTFLRRMPLRMAILLDRNSEAASAYGTNRLPESFLIDGNGFVVKKYLGPREWDSEATVSEIMSYVDSP